MLQLIWLCCLVGSNPLEVPPLLTPGPSVEPEPRLAVPNRRRGPLGPTIPSTWRGQHLVSLRLNVAETVLARVHQAILQHPLHQAWLTWSIRLDNSPTIIECRDFEELTAQKVMIGTFSSGRLAIRVQVKTGTVIWLSAVTVVDLCGPPEIEVRLQLRRPVNHLHLVMYDLPPLSQKGKIQLEANFHPDDPSSSANAEQVWLTLSADRTVALAEYDDLSLGHYLAQFYLLDDQGNRLTATFASVTIIDTDTFVLVSWGYKDSRLALSTGSEPVFFCCL